MTRPLTRQTHAILRSIKAGKSSAQIARDLNIPTYTVYNTKHRHKSLITPVKKNPAVLAPLPSEDVGTFASRNAAQWANEGQPVYVTPMRKRLSLWGRIKAVFTGYYS